jgi:hypothetical protein
MATDGLRLAGQQAIDAKRGMQSTLSVFALVASKKCSLHACVSK